MTQVERTERDLAKLPPELAEGAVAGIALAMAAVLDGGKGSPSECGRVALEAWETLRNLSPPEEKKGMLHDLTAQRAKRVARRTGTADQASS